MSEYGRGYATCLMSFAYHEPVIRRHLDLYVRMRGAGGDTRLWTDQHALELWFNAASDHLFELIRPPKIGERDWQTASSIAERAKMIGHGFRGVPITVAETFQMIEISGGLVNKAARQEKVQINSFDDLVELDRRLGIEPIVGDLQCKDYLPMESVIGKAATSERRKVLRSRETGRHLDTDA